MGTNHNIVTPSPGGRTAIRTLKNVTGNSYGLSNRFKPARSEGEAAAAARCLIDLTVNDLNEYQLNSLDCMWGNLYLYINYLISNRSKLHIIRHTVMLIRTTNTNNTLLSSLSLSLSPDHVDFIGIYAAPISIA